MESHLLPNRWNWNNINYLIISPIFITLLVVSKSYCCTQLSTSTTCPACKMLSYQFSLILCIKGQIGLNVTNVFTIHSSLNSSIHPSIPFFPVFFSFGITTADPIWQAIGTIKSSSLAEGQQGVASTCGPPDLNPGPFLRSKVQQNELYQWAITPEITTILL